MLQYKVTYVVYYAYLGLPPHAIMSNRSTLDFCSVVGAEFVASNWEYVDNMITRRFGI